MKDRLHVFVMPVDYVERHLEIVSANGGLHFKNDETGEYDYFPPRTHYHFRGALQGIDGTWFYFATTDSDFNPNPSDIYRFMKGHPKMLSNLHNRWNGHFLGNLGEVAERLRYMFELGNL